MESTDVEPDRRLCLYCSRLVSKLDGPLRRIELGQAPFPVEEPLGFQPWLAAAENGCGMCSAFLDGLRSFDGEVISTSSSKFWRTISGKAKGSMSTLRLEHRDDFSRDLEGQNKIITLERQIKTDDGSFFSETLITERESIREPQLHAPTGSERSLSFAQQITQEMPKLTPQMSQIQRTGFETIPLYTTLSHCWGSLEIFKLKKSSIDSLLHHGFPHERLPKTFQDAIKVSQSLGFKYIWIDSLCIVQDDVEDWGRESSLMSNVYGNAILNIAATNAKDGSEGLFVERGTGRTKIHYFRTPDKRLWEINPTRFYEEFVASAPLSSRAWAFQERYLAHRALHFSADELFWECREHMACETFPDGYPMSTVHQTHRFPSRDDLTGWCRAISIYSKADLTYPSDKLIAISGVARNFQERFPDQYLAGLWKENLGRQLCWAVQHRDRKSEKKSTVYRAPSWSWASTDQPVTWRLYSTNDVSSCEPNQDILVRLMNFNIIPIGTDLLGQLQDAELELACGPILKETFFQAYRLDSKEPSDFEYFSEITDPPENTGFYLDGRTKDLYDADEEFADCERLYLPILEHRGRGTILLPENLSIYGLVLKKVDIRGKGYFSRIGVFDKAFKKDSYVELMESLSGHEDMFMDEAEYQQVLEPDSRGIKQYSISLT